MHSSGIKQISRYFNNLSIFIILFFPRVFSYPRAIVLIIAISLSLYYNLISNRKCATHYLLVLIGIYLFYAFLAVLVGVIRNTPGVNSYFRLNIVWFCGYFLFILGISNSSDFIDIIRVEIFSSNVICIYNILLSISTLTGRFYIPLIDKYSRVVLHSEGYLHIISTNTSMLIMTVPLLISLVFIDKFKVKDYLGLNYKYVLFSCLLGIIVALLTGRRVIWLVVMISFLINILIGKKNANKILYIIVAFALSIALIFNGNINGVIGRFVSAFNKNIESTRYDEIHALWVGARKHLFLGAGAGAGINIDTLVESADNPWVYEVSYNVILYNSGIFGFLIYVAFIISLIIKCYKGHIARKAISILSISIFCSFLSVVIANATNPYFSSSFDFMWMLFFPLAYVNVLHIKEL